MIYVQFFKVITVYLQSLNVICQWFFFTKFKGNGGSGAVWDVSK